MRTPQTKHKGGFTLLELLVVIMIIGVLVGLLLPTVATLRNSARRRQAKTKALSFVAAVTKYRAEYGKYPGQTQDDVDQFIEPDEILEGLIENPRDIVFMDLTPDDITEDGDLADPWGMPYVVAINENGDHETEMEGSISGPFGTATFSTNVPKVDVCLVSWGGEPTRIEARVYSWRD